MFDQLSKPNKTKPNQYHHECRDKTVVCVSMKSIERRYTERICMKWLNLLNYEIIQCKPTHNTGTKAYLGQG